MSDDECRRCGESVEDLRFLAVSFGADLSAHDIPFERLAIYGQHCEFLGMREHESGKFKEPEWGEPQGEHGMWRAWTLSLCKRCRGDWIAVMEAWFNFRDVGPLCRPEDREPPVYRSAWPEGLTHNVHYEFPCDDKGATGGSWLRVFVANDGDAHCSMQEWENIREPESSPSPLPSVRCRSYSGGGRFRRTRQVLLWLADAIRRDRIELGMDR